MGLNVLAKRSAFIYAFCAVSLCLSSIFAESQSDQGRANKHEAAKVLFDQVVQLILPDGKYRCDDHSRTDKLKRIRSEGVPPDFAAIMLPADDAPFELRRQYVMVMAEFDHPSKHLTLIEKLASERPDDHDLSALQLVATPSTQRPALIQAMARDPKNDLSALYERLSPLLDADAPQDAAAYRTMLGNWRLVVDLFAAIPPAQGSDKYVYSYEPIYLIFDGSEHRFGIPPLLPATPTTPPTPELAALASQRTETIHAVAMAMHANPATTSKAFAILHYARDAFHLDEAKLRQLALHSCQIILREEDRSCREDSFTLGDFVNLRPGRFSDTRFDLQRSSAGVTPYGYLLDQALQTRSFHAPLEFLQCFDEENRKTLQAGLDFFAKPTTSQAEKMLPQWVADDEPIPAPTIALPAAIAGLCGIDIHKGFSSLLDATKSSEPPYRQYQQIELLALLANASLEHRNINQLAATIREATQRFTGQSRPPDSPSGSDAIGAMLYRIHCPPDDCALIRIFLAAHQPGLTSSAPRIRLPDSPSESARILLTSHLFHPGPGMFVHDGGMISSSDDLGFLPFAVIQYNPKEEILKSEDSPFQELGRELLETTGLERFWARITGAYLGKQDATVVSTELEREMQMIRTWPAAEQHSLAKFLLNRWPELYSGSLIPWFRLANATSPIDSNEN